MPPFLTYNRPVQDPFPPRLLHKSSARNNSNIIISLRDVNSSASQARVLLTSCTPRTPSSGCDETLLPGMYSCFMPQGRQVLVGVLRDSELCKLLVFADIGVRLAAALRSRGLLLPKVWQGGSGTLSQAAMLASHSRTIRFTGKHQPGSTPSTGGLSSRHGPFGAQTTR